MDDKGGMSAIQRTQLPLRIPDADARRVLASQLGYDVKLLVMPGRQRIAFVVRDEVARVSSCVIQEVDVDKKGNAALVGSVGAVGPSAPGGAQAPGAAATSAERRDEPR